MSAPKRKRPEKRYLKIDDLDEVSAVDVPAQEGARAVAIGKRATLVEGTMAKAKKDDGDADDVEKDMITCPMCGAKIDPSGDEFGGSPKKAMKSHVEKNCGYMKRDFSSDERQAAADSGAALPDGSYPIKNTSDLENAIHAWGRAKPGDRGKVAAHIKSRAKSLGATDKLPDEGPLAEALGTTKKRAPQEDDAMTTEIETLKKRAEEAEALAKRWQAIAQLPEGQRGYVLALPEAQRDGFISKSAADRAKDAEPVFVSKSTGARYYSHDDQRSVDLAKALEAQTEELAKARQANDDLVFAKRADEMLGHCPGDLATRVAVVKAVSNIADEKVREGALALLKAGDSAISKAYDRTGRAFTLESIEKSADDSPTGEYDRQVATFAKAHKLDDLAAAEAKFLATPEGAKAYAELEHGKRN